MEFRFARTVAASALLVVGGAGCEQDSSMITEGTVELAVVTDGQGGRRFAIPMWQEVTSLPEWEGEPDGRGEAHLSINVGKREVCWKLYATSVALPATAAHIHEAPASVRGPIVVTLSAPDLTGRATGCVADANRDLLRRILNRPGQFYVNVHTTEFPAGAVRGQVAR